MSAPVETKIDLGSYVEEFNNGIVAAQFTRIELEEPKHFNAAFDNRGISGLKQMVTYLEERSGLHASTIPDRQDTAVIMVADADSVLLAIMPRVQLRPGAGRIYTFNGSKGSYSLIGGTPNHKDISLIAYPCQTIMFGWISEIPEAQRFPTGQTSDDYPMYKTYRDLMDAAKTGSGRRVGRGMFASLGGFGRRSRQ